MSVNKVNLEIDGKKVQADLGAMIIEAADNNDVYIPRFCYHKKLSVAANCRMCLIEIDGMKKAMPACATPITEGMKIRTRSELARKAQKAVMEFLLINHPLDCPICDQGGQCELQDLAVGFGQNESQYIEKKRVVADENLGPLIATDMTRCIHCTRCVRFLTEVAGKPELGTMGRGEHTEISTLIERNIDSEVSGNIIDLCPVGALTSKPFRFTARAWELQQRPLIALHDCVGSNVSAHFINKMVKRVVPRTNEAVNENWISDRDRYSYAALNSENRLLQPMVKRNEQWETVDWTTALEIVASSLENVRNHYSAEAIAGLISPNATIEEQFLFQKLLREFGSENIDHRIRQLDFSADFTNSGQDYSQSSLGLPITELSQCDVILLIGSDIHSEQPVLALRAIKASKEGATILSVNSYDYPTNFVQKVKQVVAPQELPLAVAGILKALSGLKNKTISEVNSITVTSEAQSIAEQLTEGKKIAIILGAGAQNHPQYATISALSQHISQLSGASFGILSQGANAAGAHLVGALPRNNGLNAQTMFSNPRKAYLLFNVEPEFDCANPVVAIEALKQADFVVSFTPFLGAAQREYADVVLPIAPFAENVGTVINCNDVWQSFAATVPARGEARPGWKVLRVLGNFLDLPNFEYEACTEVTLEIQQHVAERTPVAKTIPAIPAITPLSGLMRYSDWLIYRIDNVVRHSPPLQAVHIHNNFSVRIHPDLAQQLQVQTDGFVVLRQGSAQCTAQVQVDPRVPKQAVYVPTGTPISAQLGAIFGAIEITRANV